MQLVRELASAVSAWHINCITFCDQGKTTLFCYFFVVVDDSFILKLVVVVVSGLSIDVKMIWKKL